VTQVLEVESDPRLEDLIERVLAGDRIVISGQQLPRTDRCTTGIRSTAS
jgi:hypothetical protein